MNHEEAKRILPCVCLADEGHQSTCFAVKRRAVAAALAEARNAALEEAALAAYKALIPMGGYQRDVCRKIRALKIGK